MIDNGDSGRSVAGRRRSETTILDELAAVELELWLIVLATLTLDVYLTYRGLRSGLAEGNPIMSGAIHGIGFAALGLTKAVALGVAGFLRELLPEHGPVIPLGLSVPWLLAVVVNSVLIVPAAFFVF